MWSTLLSWTALLGVAAALTLYYNPDLLRRFQQPTPPFKEPVAAPKKKAKRTQVSRVDGEDKNAGSAPGSGTEATVSKKRKIAPVQVEKDVRTTPKLAKEESDEMSNRDFAQQLAKAQAGTNLEKTAGPKQKARTVKPGKAFESPSLSADTSSTGGVDADDDMSPVGSPPTGPASTAPTSRVGDVSDMLEAPAPKPTTLRLIDTEEKKKQKPLPKQVEQPLTKKQRQRQARNEQDRAMKEEAARKEKELMEKQIRGARMAAGTSNQTKANNFKPTQNAWKASELPAAQPTTLLDTFDPNKTPTADKGAVSVQPLSNITNGVGVKAAQEEVGKKKVEALGASTRERPGLSREASWADEVNEEEQTKWEKQLQEEEKWEPVTSKKSKKKGKKDTDTSSEASASLPRPEQNGVSKTNGFKPESNNRFETMGATAGADWEA
jgi:hypothetical protein